MKSVIKTKIKVAKETQIQITCPSERGEDGSKPKPYSAAAAAASACVTVPGPIFRNPTFLKTFKVKNIVKYAIFLLKGLSAC